ncbi:MAG: hypothetical protein INR69_12205 [Mucilaginibacter polytrichastri]|nr:hypothetical protein [Mucilaginibacter polytrichastri]
MGNAIFLKHLTLLLLGIAFDHCLHAQTWVLNTDDKKLLGDTATGLDQPRKFILKKKALNADFNYARLDSINIPTGEANTERSKLRHFEAGNGNFIFYQFIATFKGESLNPDMPRMTEIKDFHDVLIIKTTVDGMIVDAYEYTLEWAERPMYYDLLRRSKKGLILADGMEINSLKFRRVSDGNGKQPRVEECGRLVTAADKRETK